MTIADLLSVIGLSTFVATAATIATLHAPDILRRIRPRVAGDADAAMQGDREGVAAFLLQGDILCDATPTARRIADLARDGGSARDRIFGSLRPRFPDLDSRVAMLPDGGTDRLAAADDDGSLDLRSIDGRLSLTLRAARPTEPPGTGSAGTGSAGGNPAGAVAAGVAPPSRTCEGPDAMAMRAFEDELRVLRATTDHTPVPIWRQTRDGRITWVNHAYLDTVRARRPGACHRAWPLPPLFDTAAAMAASDDGHSRRLCLPATDTLPAAWYECHFATVGEEVMISAVDVDAVVRAEGALRDFVQTLSKTFAHLTVGLAVFGKDRRLAMFNPALGDLTGLPVTSLIKRPTLATFFDALRSAKMMPEPKDYTGWRDRMARLEAEIADGTFSEEWHLPFDRTYRITGRPQPDGALALLFEDISAEVGLTRRFRTELDTGRAVLDTMSEAIAVFDAGGVLTMSNTAYDALWGSNTREGIATATIAEAARSWSAATPPTAVWTDVTGWLSRGGDRAPWSARTPLRDGRTLECRLDPLPGGAALVRFALPVPDCDSAPRIVAAQPETNPAAAGVAH